MSVPPPRSGCCRLSLLPVPLLLNPYQQYVLNTALLYVPVGIGFNLVVGNLGLLAFSNVAYFGLGAYTSGVLMAQLGMPWWLTVIPAALVGGIGGAIASIPALRGVRLFYLAIMTLAFGELMRWTYIRWEALTGGSMGMAVPTATLFGWALDTDRRRFYAFLALVVLIVAITDRLLRSRFGRAFLAIKDNEIAAAAMGIPTDRYIVLAFAWGGAVVGVGGAMFAISVGHLTPVSFDLTELIRQFAIIMVGGLASLTGAIIGAVIITVAPQVFISFPGFDELVFGLLIVLVILFLPRGLASLLARRASRVRRALLSWTDAPLLSVRDVTVRFGGLVAVGGVSFDLHGGEICALIGPNGAGKTTLFNAVSGNVVADGGSIRFRGEEIAGLTPHEISARGARRTFQNGGLFPELTALENVLVGLHAQVGSGFLRPVVRPSFGGRGSVRDDARARTAVGDGHRAHRRPESGRTLRRPAAHGGDRACARHQSAAVAARRTRGGPGAGRAPATRRRHP